MLGGGVDKGKGPKHSLKVTMRMNQSLLGLEGEAESLNEVQAGAAMPETSERENSVTSQLTVTWFMCSVIMAMADKYTYVSCDHFISNSERITGRTWRKTKGGTEEASGKDLDQHPCKYCINRSSVEVCAACPLPDPQALIL